MALTEKTEYDSITILLDGQMMVRKTRIIMDNGIEIARNHHRTVLVPGQDVSSYPNKVKNLCAFVWTPAVIAAWNAAHPPINP